MFIILKETLFFIFITNIGKIFVNEKSTTVPLLIIINTYFNYELKIFTQHLFYLYFRTKCISHLLKIPDTLTLHFCEN